MMTVITECTCTVRHLRTESGRVCEVLVTSPDCPEYRYHRADLARY